MASSDSIDKSNDVYNNDSITTFESQTEKQSIDPLSVQGCPFDCVCKKCTIDPKFPSLKEHQKSLITPPSIPYQNFLREFYNDNIQVGRNILCAWCCKKCANFYVKRNFSGAFQCKCGIIETAMCSCKNDTSEFEF